MNLERELNKRSNGACELCGSTENLKQYDILPQRKADLDESIYLCNVCLDQIENPENADANHWRCLNDSMWSEHIPVQVMSYRLLKRFGNHELAEQIYMDEETLEWAKATAEGEEDENKLVHRDSNGVILNTGDSVVLIKDLKVKGSSMVAKQGTAVRNIRLDHENETYIEGRVDGQQIVIITQYVKKL